MSRVKSSQVVSVGLGLSLMVALVIGVFVNNKRPDLPPEVRPKVGFRAPSLVNSKEINGRTVKEPLVDLRGKPVRLEEYRGRVVFLNFWATWCPPCREEMPNIERIQKEYGDRVKVLAVNATAQDDEDAARRFVQGLGLTFDVPLDRTGEVTETYQGNFFPSTFIIDGNGVIREKIEGAMNYAMMDAAVRKVMRMR